MTIPSSPSAELPGGAPGDRPNRDLMVAVKGGGILFAGQVFEQVSGLVFAIFMGRFLGADDYGVYKLALTIVFAVSVLATLGLAGGMTRFIPLARLMKSDARIWGVIQLGTGVPVLIGLVAAAAIMFTADPVSIGIFEEPALVNVLLVVALAIPVHAANLSLAAVAQGFKQVKYEFYAQDITFNALKLVLSVGAILLGFGIMGVTIAYVVAEVVALLLLFYFVNRMFSFFRSFQSADRPTRELFNFSLPLFGSQFLNQFGRRFETIILGIFGVMTDVGVYSAILIISDVGNRAYLALRKISAPIFAELHEAGKKKELRTVYQAISKWALVTNLPFFAVIVMFSEGLLQVFGNDFVLGAEGLIILSCGTLLNAATGACGTLLSMIGRSRLTMLNSGIYLAATIGIDLLLIPTYGLLGAAWAGSLTIMLVNLIRLFQVYYLVDGLLPFNLSFLKPIAAITGVYVFITWLRSMVFAEDPILQFIVLGVLTFALYVGAVLALGISQEDRAIAKGIMRKVRRPKGKQPNTIQRNDS